MEDFDEEDLVDISPPKKAKKRRGRAKPKTIADGIDFFSKYKRKQVPLDEVRLSYEKWRTQNRYTPLVFTKWRKPHHLRGPKAFKQSQFRGVYWCKSTACWEVKVNVKNKKITLGYFENEMEAAKFYDRYLVYFITKRLAINFPTDYGGIDEYSDIVTQYPYIPKGEVNFLDFDQETETEEDSPSEFDFGIDDDD